MAEQPSAGLIKLVRIIDKFTDTTGTLGGVARTCRWCWR